MASEKPKLSRAGTMQQTAEEGAEFLARQGFDGHEAAAVTEHCEGGDDEQEEQGDDDNEPSPKRLKRQSTMAATAKEGSEFLQREGYISDSPEGTPPDQSDDDQETPKVKRATTMEVTAKEGAEFVARMQGTKEKTVTFEDQVPRLQRDSTIDVTVKEGEEFLKRTGGIKDTESEDDSSAEEEHATETASRPKLQRDSTIDVTVKEGEEFLRRSGALPNEDGDEERSTNDDNEGDEAEVADEQDDEECVPLLARDTTMKETAKIGEQFVGEDGRAESRSQTKLLREAEQESGSANTGRAPLKRAGTMDVTKAEGEEFLKRKKT
ncbi:uncharacterized protein LOC144658269 isoform X1 [Oculina patagonica]